MICRTAQIVGGTAQDDYREFLLDYRACLAKKAFANQAQRV
ncbi:MAG: hypothetical protein ABIO36_01515 [Pyrinomonadaceae bacterium]